MIIAYGSYYWTLFRLTSDETNHKSCDNLKIKNYNRHFYSAYLAVTWLQWWWRICITNKFILFLSISAETFNSATYMSIIAVFIIVLIILIIYLVFKVRREKMFRKELAKAGLLYFKEGVTKSLNPELGIDEQAELLPYNDRFEFPAENLILGKLTHVFPVFVTVRIH